MISPIMLVQERSAPENLYTGKLCTSIPADGLVFPARAILHQTLFALFLFLRFNSDRKVEAAG